MVLGESLFALNLKILNQGGGIIANQMSCVLMLQISIRFLELLVFLTLLFLGLCVDMLLQALLSAIDDEISLLFMKLFVTFFDVFHHAIFVVFHCF
jgi:hypothetical protein